MLKQDENGLIPAIVQDADTGQVLMLGYLSPESLRLTLEQGQVWFYSRSRQELWHKGATSGSYLNLRSVTADCDGDALLLQVEPTGPVCHTGAQSCFFQPVTEPQWQSSAHPVRLADSDIIPPPCGVGEPACPERSRRVEGRAARGSTGSPRAEEPLTLSLSKGPSEPAEGPGILSELWAVIQERQRTMPQGSYTASVLKGGVDRAGQKVIEEAGEAVIAAKNADRQAVAAEMADLWFHSLLLLAAAGVPPEAVWQELERRRRPSTGLP